MCMRKSIKTGTSNYKFIYFDLTEIFIQLGYFRVNSEKFSFIINYIRSNQGLVVLFHLECYCVNVFNKPKDHVYFRHKCDVT